MFEAEKVFSEIMESGSIPDLIICMDEKCTPGIAQLLVDYNMVGDVKLVGYGFTALTLEYIEHGVIYGTICPDAYEIGYQTVTSLIELLEGNQISDAISTGLNAIDKSNVEQYKNETEVN
jgi:ribose transport system substrate-binding protein